MGSKRLIIISLCLSPLGLFAETADDYAHRGAQKYIFGQEEAAKKEISTGLEKFPDDPDLRQMAGLFREKQRQQQQQQNQDQQQAKNNQRQPNQPNQEQNPENQNDQKNSEKRDK